jgi:putative intracellular protease/amidase
VKILMVLTSHDQLGNTGRKTGFWLEEFAAPYFVFRDAGVDLTLASPKGGQPPIDPKSDLPENQTPAMARFKQDAAAQKPGEGQALCKIELLELRRAERRQCM